MFHTNNPKKQFVKFETEKYEDNHCREIIITCDNFSEKITLNSAEQLKMSCL